MVDDDSRPSSVKTPRIVQLSLHNAHLEENEVLEVMGLANDIKIPKILLDTGAAANFVSLGWIRENNLEHKVVSSKLNVVELGATGNNMKIFGKIKLDVSIEEQEATADFEVFDTGRDMILGMRSLLRDFFPVLSNRVHQIRHVLSCAEEEKKALYNLDLTIGSPKYPKEPKGHRVDVATDMAEGEIRALHPGPEEEAEELQDIDNEYKNMTVRDEILLKEEEYENLIKSNSMLDESFTKSTEFKDIMSEISKKEIFAPSRWEGLKKVEPVSIDLIEGAPTYMHDKVRRIASTLQTPAENALKENVKDGFLVLDSSSRYSSALVVVEKPKTPHIARLCGDFTRINKIIVPRTLAIPDALLSLETMKKYKLFAESDWTRSFHQIPITNDTSKLLTIITPYGAYRPRFLPEGVQPASGILAEVVREIFGDYREWCLAVHDNILIGAHDEEDLLRKWKIIMRRCEDYNIKLSPSKTKVGLKEVEWFGYMVGYGKYWASDKRLEAITKVKFPTTQQAMRRFIGMSVFVAPFIENYAQIAAPLTALLAKDIEWSEVLKNVNEHMPNFDKLKEGIKDATRLHLPNYNLQWILRTDASDIATGGVLMQVNPDNPIQQEEPIAYVSHKFSKEAKRWSVLEKELFSIIFAMKRLDYYIRGKALLIETDHSNILYLDKTIIPKLLRWKLLINSYPITIKHIPGRLNTVADALSRADMDTEVNGKASETTTQLNYIDQTLQQIVYSGGKELQHIINNDDLTAVLFNLSINPVVEGKGQQLETDVRAKFDEAHIKGKIHKGALKTYNRLALLYPDLKIRFDAVQQQVDACPTCQKFKADILDAVKTLRYGLKAETHRSLVCVDVLGMEKDTNENIYCYVITNAATKLLYLYPSKTKNELATINALLSYIGIYGIMDAIRSDPGAEFTAHSVKHLFNRLGITWQLGVVGRPQSHGTEKSVGKTIESVRVILAEAKEDLQWSDPAVLSTLAFLWNTEVNKETDDTPFNLTFGKGDKDFNRLTGDITDVDTSIATTQYLNALDKHLTVARETAQGVRLARQQDRQSSNNPPGNHQYLPGDLVFLKDKGPMRARKFLANKLGPYRVVEQKEEGRVLLQDITDDSKQKEAHHNLLSIFEGSTVQAKKLAILDKGENVINSITDCRGSIYAKAFTTYKVIWEDGTTTWEPYGVVSNTIPFDDFTRDYPHLKRLLMTNVEFREWQTKIKGLTKRELAESYYVPEVSAVPINDKAIHAFALNIHYLDKVDLFSNIKYERIRPSRAYRGTSWTIDPLDRISDPKIFVFVRCYLVKITKNKFDIWIPVLSEKNSYRTLPARGAYVTSLNASDLVQFVAAIPQALSEPYKDIIEIDNNMIERTNIRELIYPDLWEEGIRRQRQSVQRVLRNPEAVEEEHEEPTSKGELYDKEGTIRILGKKYDVVVKGEFDDGDILVRVNKTGNEIKMRPAAVSIKNSLPLALLTRKGIISYSPAGTQLLYTND